MMWAQSMANLHPIQKLVLLTIALLLPAYGLLTMPIDGIIARTAMRNLSLPILAGEMLFCLLAVASGVTLSTIWRNTSSLSRWSAVLWLVAASCSTFLLEPANGSGNGLFMMSVGHLLFASLGVAALRTFWLPLRSYLLPSLSIGIAAFTALAVAFSIYAARFPDFQWVYFGFGAGNVRHLGYYSVILTGISLGLLLNREGSSEKFAFVLLLFGTFLLFWSGGRGPILCLLGQIVIFSACLPSGGKVRLLGNVAVISALSLILAYFLAPDEHWGPSGLFSQPIEADGLNDFSSNRIAVWRECFAVILEKPLMGYGPGQFKSQISSAGGWLAQPHNLVLQMLFHWGIVGSLCLLGVVAGTLKPSLLGAVIRDRSAPPAILAFSGLIALSVIDGALFYPFPVIAAILCIAVIVSAPILDDISSS